VDQLKLIVANVYARALFSLVRLLHSQSRHGGRKSSVLGRCRLRILLLFLTSSSLNGIGARTELELIVSMYALVVSDRLHCEQVTLQGGHHGDISVSGTGP
jgi:hypothetical protein